MTIKQILRIKGDQLVINLPEGLKSSGKEVLVTIEDNAEIRKSKLELMKGAAKDPLFLEDLSQISSDFETSDLE